MSSRTANFCCLLPGLALLLLAGIIPGEANPDLTPAKEVAAITTPASLPDQGPRLAGTYGHLPLHFVENRGQTSRQVRYYSQGQGYGLYFTRTGAVFALRRGTHDRDAAPKDGSPRGRDRVRDTAPPTVVRMTPVGLNKKVKVEACEPLLGKVNYFRGNDPKKWRTDLPTYRAVLYREAYPGIDLKFYGDGRQVEYDVIVKPGADPNRVHFQYAGVKGLKVTQEGDLALTLPDGGQLLQKKPVVYQEIGGARVPLEGRFTLRRHGARLTCGFAVAAYDPRHLLVIDPVLVYSTYLGGSGNYDFPSTIAVDAAGCAYVAGSTISSDFPLQNPLQATYKGGWEGFVTKLNATGNALVYSTYLGGSNDDYIGGIAVDAAGCAYIAGRTNSNDFPTQNPIQPINAGAGDAFVTKLSAAGNALVYSTYLGGGDNDYGSAIAVDAAGCAYIAGSTYSDDFPTQNPLQDALKGSSDIFVTKVNAAGTAWVYSTYLGGSGYDPSYYSLSNRMIAIAVDVAGCAYVAGCTDSFDFPTQNPLQAESGGGSDAFVAKFSAQGNTLVYSTYLGGGTMMKPVPLRWTPPAAPMSPDGPGPPTFPSRTPCKPPTKAIPTPLWPS